MKLAGLFILGLGLGLLTTIFFLYRNLIELGWQASRLDFISRLNTHLDAFPDDPERAIEATMMDIYTDHRPTHKLVTLIMRENKDAEAEEHT